MDAGSLAGQEVTESCLCLPSPEIIGMRHADLSTRLGVGIGRRMNLDPTAGVANTD